MGTLYIVEMPPLDRRDLTLRARRILEQVPVVVTLPQDVQVAQNRLFGCGIQHKSVEFYDRETILAHLKTGDVALLARISSRIDQPMQSLLEHDIPMIPIPGPVDPITALVASGFSAERFVFLGSLPASPSELVVVWQSIENDPHTVVCDTLAQNLGVAFDTLVSVLGQRRMAVYHEESIWRGDTSQLPPEPAGTSGQVILAIQGAVKHVEVWSEAKIRAEIEANLQRGASLREFVAELATRSGWQKRQIYALATAIKAGSPPEHTNR